MLRHNAVYFKHNVVITINHIFKTERLECSSAAEHLPCTYSALGLIPNNTKETQGN